jgi:hypothetical protein
VSFEIFKTVVPLLGGSLAGSLFTIWYNRKQNKLQRIPLIERVNRAVSTDLEGITLARRFGGSNGDSTQLEEVKNLREYQMTLRNTSTIHLRDVEIQFEFSGEDVIASVQRPALSKTPLLAVICTVTDPWKKGFRWQIPHLPSGDSIEFTFQAIDPPSTDYEVALYKSERVIVETVKGEPASKEGIELTGIPALLAALGLLALIVLPIAFPLYGMFFPDSKTNTSNIIEAGCILSVDSRYDRYKSEAGTVWRISHHVHNDGEQDCTVQTPQLDIADHPYVIRAHSGLNGSTTSFSRPKLISTDLLVGTNSTSLKKITVDFYR